MSARPKVSFQQDPRQQRHSSSGGGMAGYGRWRSRTSSCPMHASRGAQLPARAAGKRGTIAVAAALLSALVF